jgi:hypothetical protein
VQSVIARRYRGLGPVEQRVFRSLAVFRGEFSHAAAAAVCLDEPAAVIAACDVLVRDGLVRCRSDGGPARLHLATMTRDLALELLDQAGEYELARERHTDWSAGFAAALAPRLTGDDPDPAWCDSRPSGPTSRTPSTGCSSGATARVWCSCCTICGRSSRHDGRLATARLWLEAIPAPCEHMSATTQAQYVRMTDDLAAIDRGALLP